MTLAGCRVRVKKTARRNECGRYGAWSMVQSSLATVDAWLAGVDPVRAPYLAKVRDMALKHFGVETESMRYGMPTYTRPDATDPASVPASMPCMPRR